jgi:hypothetical protein
MTPVRPIDTQRLSIVAHEYEREIVRFYRDLMGGERGVARIRQEAEKVGFEEIRVDAAGNLLARIGSGRHVIGMDPHDEAAGIAAMVYGGKLIHELGMYDDFTLWVGYANRPECVLIAEPTNLCIRRRETDELTHPLVQAAVDTYETLFELPPIINHAVSAGGPKSVPSIAFGPGEEGLGDCVPVRHLLQAAQFYAAFPTMFATTVNPR